VETQGSRVRLLLGQNGSRHEIRARETGDLHQDKVEVLLRRTVQDFQDDYGQVGGVGNEVSS